MQLRLSNSLKRHEDRGNIYTVVVQCFLFSLKQIKHVPRPCDLSIIRSIAFQANNVNDLLTMLTCFY